MDAMDDGREDAVPRRPQDKSRWRRRATSASSRSRRRFCRSSSGSTSDGSKGTSYFKEIRKIALCADCVARHKVVLSSDDEYTDLIADYCGQRLGELCPCKGLEKAKKEMVEKDNRIKALEAKLAPAVSLPPAAGGVRLPRRMISTIIGPCS